MSEWPELEPCECGRTPVEGRHGMEYPFSYSVKCGCGLRVEECSSWEHAAREWSDYMDERRRERERAMQRVPTVKVDREASAALEELVADWAHMRRGGLPGYGTCAEALRSLLLRMESSPEPVRDACGYVLADETECGNCERPVCRRQGCAVWSEVGQALCVDCYEDEENGETPRDRYSRIDQDTRPI